MPVHSVINLNDLLPAAPAGKSNVTWQIDSTVDPPNVSAYTGGGGGGSSTLAADTDVNITSPTNGQLLIYDSGTSKWKNHTLVAGDIPNIAETQVTNLVSDLGLKAPLASPALTGNPTAPTQSSSDNSTKLATTAFVTTAVAAVPNSLAADSDVSITSVGNGQLLIYDSGTGKWENRVLVAGDIPNIAESQVTGLVADLALKAPLASPALTGTPTSPNAIAFTSNTQIANTKYVDDAVAAAETGIISSGAAPPRSLTVKTTGTLAVGAAETGALTLSKAFFIQKIAMDRTSRIRLYVTAAARDADLSRPFTVPLGLGKSHGCMVDLYVDGTSSYPLTFELSPALPGYNDDGTQSTNIYYTIENFSSGSHTVQAQITFNSTQS